LEKRGSERFKEGKRIGFCLQDILMGMNIQETTKRRVFEKNSEKEREKQIGEGGENEKVIVACNINKKGLKKCGMRKKEAKEIDQKKTSYENRIEEATVFGKNGGDQKGHRAPWQYRIKKRDKGGLWFDKKKKSRIQCGVQSLTRERPISLAPVKGSPLRRSVT